MWLLVGGHPQAPINPEHISGKSEMLEQQIPVFTVPPVVRHFASPSLAPPLPAAPVVPPAPIALLHDGYPRLETGWALGASGGYQPVANP